MNATVQATNDAILRAEFEQTKYLGYMITAKTTGIADLRNRFRSPHYDVKHQDYLPLSESGERYYGTFSLNERSK
jgi:hypothetical protein